MDFELTIHNIEMEENMQENLNSRNIMGIASIHSPSAKSTPLQGEMSSTGLSGEIMHSITMTAGKTQCLIMGLQQSCASIMTAQINNPFKMTNTSGRLWEERTDQRVFVH
jgi:hypothetical protein